MPIIYLSPSTQEFNPYITGGSEEYYMNLIADAMEPYLVSSGIEFTRNTPDMTASSSIAQSNAGNYDLHLALHSNASPPEISGQKRGTDVFYFPSSYEGRRAADIIVQNLKAIYPLPDEVRAVPSTTIGEVSKVRAPSVFIEFAYHDNYQDALWITSNIGNIARNVVVSLTEYFDIPFVEPMTPVNGTVMLNSGYLNIREKPNINSAAIGRIKNGNSVTVLGMTGDWYVIKYGDIAGYAASRYILI